MLLLKGYEVRSLKLSNLWSHAALPVCCGNELPLYVLAVSSVVDKLLLLLLGRTVDNVSGWFAGSAEGQGSGS